MEILKYAKFFLPNWNHCYYNWVLILF